MFKDEIVEEIHRIRQEYSRSLNHDLKAIFTDLQKQQDESGREFVNLSRQHARITRFNATEKRSE
jgi:RNA binding exosome subunit